jgi:protein-tyrosine phosphatase
MAVHFLKGLSRGVVDTLSIRLGRYDALKRINPEGVERLVFVCRGNVCRSPYGEAAAKSLGLSAVSCGVEVSYSAPAEETAIAAALLRGKDLSCHMSQSIFQLPLKSTDCLVAMDSSHLPVAGKVALQTGCQITLLGLWMPTAAPNIADPYGKSVEVFAGCFGEIDAGLLGLTTAFDRAGSAVTAPLRLG